MLKFLILTVVAIVGLSSLTPGKARAWDPEADRLVADLAYARLTPPVKARVDQIIAQAGPIGDPGCRVHALADASRLADCLHGRKGDFMKGVRYDAIPTCGEKADTRPCPNGMCASLILRQALASLKAANADPNATPAGRAVLLETVVYLMAETHEPLHAADNGDTTATRVRVTLPGAPNGRLNLYGVWDEDFVAGAVGSEETGLPYLKPLAEVRGAQWSQGDLDSWLSDTHEVAVNDVYKRLPDTAPCGHAPSKPEALDRGYVDMATQSVRLQLAKAGVRLAVVLNAALAPSPSVLGEGPLAAPDPAPATGSEADLPTPPPPAQPVQEVAPITSTPVANGPPG
ncbi:MAG: S1/P1 nuclease [Caulobacteraceae bacterium]